MRQLAVFLLSLVCAAADEDIFTQERLNVKAQEEVAPISLDPSFSFAETNLSAVLDIEVFPDARIAYAGVDKTGGVNTTIGLASASGALLQRNFGGTLWSEARSVSVDSRELIVYGAGVPENLASTNEFDGPATKIVGTRDWWPWKIHGGVLGVGNETHVLPDRQVLVAGRLRIRGDLEQTNGLVRLDLNGRVDTSWNRSGSADLEVTTFEVLNDGRILGAYRTTNATGVIQHGIGRWNTDGTRDASYPVFLATELNARVTALRKAPGTNGSVLAVETAAGEGGTVSRLISLNELGEPIAEDQLSDLLIEGTVKAIAFESTNALTVKEAGFDRIIVGGDFTQIGQFDCKNLAAVTRDGVLGWSFSATNGPDGPVEAVEVQADGKIVIGGRFTNVSGAPVNGLARLLGARAEGATYVFWSDSEFRGFERLGESELVLRRHGGTNEALAVDLALVDEIGAASDIKVPARVAFAPGEESVAVAIEIQNDAVRENREAFRVQASVTNAAVLVTRAETELVVLDDETPGTLSPEYLQWTPRFLETMAVQPDGKILIAIVPAIVRLHPDGTVDESFVTNGIPMLGSVGEIRQIEPQSDGKIYVAGKFHTTTGNPGINHVARLNADGTLDRTFDPRLRPGSTFSHRDMAATEVLDDGNLVIWTSGTVRPDFGLGGMFLVDKTGTMIRQYTGVTTWNDSAKMEHLPTGEVFAYGHGASYRQLPKYKTNGVMDTNFVARISGHLQVMEAVGDSLYVAGDIKSVNGMPVGYIAKLDAVTGAVDTNWNARVNGQIVGMEISGTHIYISGEFTEVNGKERFRVARLNLDGSLDESFDSGLGPVASSWSLHEESDGRLLLGIEGGTYDRVVAPVIVRLESGIGSAVAEPWIVEIARDAGGLEVRYSGGRLEESADLEQWGEVHTGGGEYRPSGDQPMRFYRVATP